MLFDELISKRSDNLENPSYPLNSEELSDYINSLAGQSVSEDTGLKLAAVYSCIYILSSSIAQLPLHVMRKTNGNIKVADDHAAYHLLHNSPNYWQSSYDWRETKMAHVTGWGNGFTDIIRNRRGEITEFVTPMPWQTSLVKNGGRTIYSYIDEDGKAKAVDPFDMIHVRALGSNGKMGKSPIRQHADTIGLGLAAMKYGSAFFNGGGKPSGLVSPKGAINKENWDRLKALWKGFANTLKSDDNKTILVPAEIDYKSLTIPPEEAQFLETRKFNRSEIAGLFNVPAHMINDLEKATFSNISEQAIQFVRHTIMPWIVKWEQEFNRKIFTRAEIKAGYYVKFNLAGLLRGTPTERAQFYHYAITDGWLNRNEVRAFEDKNPVEGLDEYLISVNQAQQTDKNEGNTDDK